MIKFLLHKTKSKLNLMYGKKTLVFTFILFLLFGNLMFSIVSADVTPTPIVDQPSSPCSLYNQDWGNSSKGSAIGGGLYRPNDLEPKDAIKELYTNLGKDPLFMTTSFGASDKDPIIGFNSNRNSVD